MSLRRSSAAAEPVLVGVGAVVDVDCDVVDDVGRGAGFGFADKPAPNRVEAGTVRRSRAPA